MNYLSIENLSKSFGDQVLFEHISFGVEKGQKIALIAKNGSGKTTLFNLLSGLDVPDQGNITFNNEASLGFLNQEPVFDPEKSVWECIFDSGQEMLRVIRDYEIALRNESSGSGMEQALQKMDDLKAWDFESRIREVLTRFKIFDSEKKMKSLSGGQQKRVALAKVILQDPDFILLDEPTNHLDIEMIEWLEAFLGRPNLTVFMVTHDRYFLDRVCNSIIELDRGNLFHYKGNYSYFLEQKSEREDKESSDVMKARNLLRKELDWIRRMPKARGTKSKARIQQFYELQDQASQNLQSKEIKMEVKGRRLGGKVLELEHVTKSYGSEIVIRDFSYKFQRNEKLGIVGPNGSGKTTFLELVTGALKADSGAVIKGETVVFGHFKQEGIEMDQHKRVIEAVTDIAEYIPLADGNNLTASQMLERFLFPPSTHYIRIDKLSGGEKRRLYLLQVLMKNPNFLILDEPTNDLDILTLNVLEEFLAAFKGCLVIVSHDRYMMDKLVDHLFIFREGKGIQDFNGKYMDYKRIREEEIKQPKTQKTKASGIPPKPKETKTRLSYMEKREFEQLSTEIESLEKRKDKIEQLLSGEEADPVKVSELSEELKEIMGKLHDREDRWLELSEFS